MGGYELDIGLILKALGGVALGLWILVTSILLVVDPMEGSRFKWLRTLAGWLKKVHDVLSPFALGNQKHLAQPKPYPIGRHRPKTDGVVSGTVHTPMALDEESPYREAP